MLGIRPTCTLDAAVRPILEEAPSLRRLIAAVLLLAIAITSSLVLIPRFEVLPVAAVADPVLRHAGSPTTISTISPASSRRSRSPTCHRLSGDGTLEDVVSSPEPRQRAWVLVSGLGPDRQASLSVLLLVDAEGSFGHAG